MATRILEDFEGYKALYCSTTMKAFGPIFYESDEVDEFLSWLPKDARRYDEQQLSVQVEKWREEVKQLELAQ